MAQTSSNTSHPLAVMVQLLTPPGCCHPKADPGAELLLGSATPSIHREKFAQLHQQRWQLNEVILWLWLSLPPCEQQSRECCQHMGGKGRCRSENVPGLEDECHCSQRQILGHWLSLTPSAATLLQSPSQGCQFQVTVALLTISNKGSSTN